MLKKYLVIGILIGLLLSCDSVNNNSAEGEPGKWETPEVSQGNIWQALPEFPDTGDQLYYNVIWDINVNRDNVIFAATCFEGIYRIMNNGSSWTSVNNGIEANYNSNSDLATYFVSAVGWQNEYVFAGTEDAIYRSLDNGDQWVKCMSWDEYNLVHTFKTKNIRDLYAGCYRGIYKTTDNGENWINIAEQVDWEGKGYAYDLEFNEEGELFVATAHGLMRTPDDGQTWQYFGIQDQTLDVEVDTANNIYAAIYGKLYRSDDDGNTWVTIYDNLDDFIRSVIITSQNKIFMACSGILKSEDEGTTWSNVGPDELGYMKIFYDRDGNLITATPREGVFISYE